MKTPINLISCDRCDREFSRAPILPERKTDEPPSPKNPLVVTSDKLQFIFSLNDELITYEDVCLGCEKTLGRLAKEAGPISRTRKPRAPKAPINPNQIGAE